MPSGGSDAPVFLVGMMGAGKSSVGAALAARLGRRHLDLDALVEARAGESIAALFGSGREAEFRALERATLRELDATGAIVATGGGTPLDPASLQHMLATGRVVWLRADARTLARRVGGSDRPLLGGHIGEDARAARLAELLAARSLAYARAHLTVDVDALDVEAVADAVLAGLQRG